MASNSIVLPRAVFIALTVVYLAAEFSFNARLLDVAGSLASSSEVDGLEFWGKSLSGMAAALLLAKWISGRTGKSTWKAILLASPAIPAVFWSQGTLIDQLVARATNQERQIASYLTLVPSAVLNRFADIQGLNLTPEQFASPEGKTFFALYPALAYLSPEIVKNIDRKLESLLERRIVHELGSPGRFYNEKYITLVNEMKGFYNNQYVPASNQMSSAAARDPDELWAQYQYLLERNTINPNWKNESLRKDVIQRLHKMGVPVRADFHLNDRDAFYDAVANAASGDDPRFAEESSRALGFKSTLPPGLQWVSFASHKDIQRKVQRELAKRLPDGSQIPRVVELNWSPAEVEARLYQPMVDAATARAVRQLRSGEASFGPGGKNAALGERAVRAVLVPPLALFFSLFFSILNLLNLLFDLFALTILRLHNEAQPIRRWEMRIAKGLAICAIIGAPLFLSNEVSESKAFSTLRGKIETQGGSPLSWYLTWVTKAEPACYPIADAIRRTIFWDAKFAKIAF